MVFAGQIVVAKGADIRQTAQPVPSRANDSFVDLIAASLGGGPESSCSQEMKPSLHGTGSHKGRKAQENNRKEAQLSAAGVLPGPLPSELITAPALKNSEKPPPCIPSSTCEGVLNEKGTNRELPTNQATSGPLDERKSSGTVEGSPQDGKTETANGSQAVQGLLEFKDEGVSQHSSAVHTTCDFGIGAINEGPNATARTVEGGEANVSGLEENSSIPAVPPSTQSIAIPESTILLGNSSDLAGPQVVSANENTTGTMVGVNSVYEDTKPSINTPDQKKGQSSLPGHFRIETLNRNSIPDVQTHTRVSAIDVRPNVVTTNKTMGNADGRGISSKRTAPSNARGDGSVRSLSDGKSSSGEERTISSRPTDTHTQPLEMQQSGDVQPSIASSPVTGLSRDSHSLIQRSEISSGSKFLGEQEPAFLDASRPPGAAKLDLAGSVHVARMVKQVERAEMHVGLRTAEFGSVEVHTVVREDKVGLSVGSERGNLPGLLASDSSALNNALQRNHLQLDNLRFFEMHSGTANGGSGGHQSNSQKFLGPERSQSFIPVFAPSEVAHDDVLPPGVRISVRV